MLAHASTARPRTTSSAVSSPWQGQGPVTRLKERKDHAATPKASSRLHQTTTGGPLYDGSALTAALETTATQQEYDSLGPRMYAHEMTGHYSDDARLAGSSFMSMSSSDSSDDDEEEELLAGAGLKQSKHAGRGDAAATGSGTKGFLSGGSSETFPNFDLVQFKVSSPPIDARRPSMFDRLGAIFAEQDWRDLPITHAEHCPRGKRKSGERKKHSTKAADAAAACSPILTKAGTAFDWSAYGLDFDKVESANFKHLQGESYLSGVLSKQVAGGETSTDHLVLHASQKVSMEYDLEKRGKSLRSHIQTSMRKKGRRQRTSSVGSSVASHA